MAFPSIWLKLWKNTFGEGYGCFCGSHLYFQSGFLLLTADEWIACVIFVHEVFIEQWIKKQKTTTTNRLSYES